MRMLAFIIPILNSVLGGIIKPFVAAWTDYERAKLTTGEAGFEAATKGDSVVMQAALAADTQINALKIQTFGLPIVRFMMWVAGGMSAIYFAAVVLDTLLASKAFFGAAVLGVPKLPPPFDTQVWLIVQSVFLIQAVHVGTSNVSAWLGKK